MNIFNEICFDSRFTSNIRGLIFKFYNSGETKAHCSFTVNFVNVSMNICWQYNSNQEQNVKKKLYINVNSRQDLSNNNYCFMSSKDLYDVLHYLFLY